MDGNKGSISHILNESTQACNEPNLMNFQTGPLVEQADNLLLGTKKLVFVDRFLMRLGK